MSAFNQAMGGTSSKKQGKPAKQDRKRFGPEAHQGSDHQVHRPRRRTQLVPPPLATRPQSCPPTTRRPAHGTRPAASCSTSHRVPAVRALLPAGTPVSAPAHLLNTRATHTRSIRRSSTRIMGPRKMRKQAFELYRPNIQHYRAFSSYPRSRYKYK